MKAHAIEQRTHFPPSEDNKYVADPMMVFNN